MSSSPGPLGPLQFRVRDVAAQRRFYEDVLGFDVVGEGPDGVELAASGGGARVRLEHDPDASPRPRPSVGLFHAAFLLPDRASLAEALLHLRDAGVGIEGVADHGVSEAVYVSDAEGNGIELYRDRPRETWPVDEGMVSMVTDPLDVGELLALADGPAPPPADTRLGHVHLHVGDLGAAERFFVDGLGLRVRQRDFPGALFLAEGDYHHHVGVNTWAGDRRAPGDAVGVASYAWRGDPAEAIERFSRAGFDAEAGDGEAVVEDPAGLRLVVGPGEA